MIRGLNAPISLWVDSVTFVTRVTFNRGRVVICIGQSPVTNAIL